MLVVDGARIWKIVYVNYTVFRLSISDKWRSKNTYLLLSVLQGCRGVAMYSTLWWMFWNHIHEITYLLYLEMLCVYSLEKKGWMYTWKWNDMICKIHLSSKTMACALLYWNNIFRLPLSSEKAVRLSTQQMTHFFIFRLPLSCLMWI